MKKKFLRAYFEFSKKERTGLLIFLGIILFLTVLPAWFTTAGTQPVDRTADWFPLLDSLRRQIAAEEEGGGRAGMNRVPTNTGSTGSPASAPDLFPFDPNTLEEAGWRRLGLSDKTIRTIRNYVAKGGRFHKPEDLLRIYGWQSYQPEKLLSYVRIVASDKATKPRHENTPTNNQSKERKKILEINQADSADFEALPGIGPTLARRIIQFRDKLGGFVHVEQLRETYGLADSNFLKARPWLICSSPPTQLNINTADKETLQAHPYIRWKLASAIIAYRKQHGYFNDPAELAALMLVNPAELERLKPYLCVGNEVNAIP